MTSIIRTLSFSASLAVAFAACTAITRRPRDRPRRRPRMVRCLGSRARGRSPRFPSRARRSRAAPRCQAASPLRRAAARILRRNSSWSAGPAGTQSYVVTEFDPDAPTGVGFWHWLVFDIPASVTSFAAGSGATTTQGSMSGITDFGAQYYGGPCPPPGDRPHHYTFTVSALDIPTLAGLAGSSTTGAFLAFNTRGHIIAQGTLVGTYAR